MVTALSSLLYATARRQPQAPALITAGRTWSYRELDDYAGRFAACLQRSGIGAGERVTLWAPNSAAWVAVYHGALRAGVVVNPLNALLTAEEVAYAAADCGARLLLVGTPQSAAAAKLRGHGSLQDVICIDSESNGELPTLDAALAAHEPAPPVDLAPTALAAVLYTSGTTGRSKGATLTQRSLLLNAALTAQMHGRSGDDVVVSALPLPHVYGAVVLNATLLTGACLVLHARFHEPDILADIERHRATMLEGVPTMYHYLMAYPELDRYEVSSLTRCTVGGQTMPVAKMEEVERRLGCPLIELWGMTELGGLGTTHPSLAPSRLGSIGVALPGMEVRIAAAVVGEADPPRGDIGELCIRGPLVMAGYYGNEAATRDAIDADGWLHTGDLTRQDADGYLHVVDRMKDLILTAGYNVYPAEIERVIAAHPAVAMVAVGRLPDEAKGELAKAYVVLRPGAAVSADAIIEHCREHLAAYKLPRHVQFVNDLPKTSTGKILRRELRTLDAAVAVTT